MTQPEKIHACPPDGSGLTPCCGRTPFELPLSDRISSETATCTGPEPDSLRDQYVAAISRVLLDSAGRLIPTHLAETTQAVRNTANAVLAARDIEMQRLRAELAAAGQRTEYVRRVVAGTAHTTAAGISDYDIGRHDLARAVLDALDSPSRPKEN